MTAPQAMASHSRTRGTMQPEATEEKRRRKHREAADDVKRYKDAKSRYLEYDETMVISKAESE